MENHVILCGLGRVGWHVLEFLKASGTPVVAIDTRCAPGDQRLGGVTLVQGDCAQSATLEQAGVRQARAVVIVLSDELVGISAALLVRRLNPAVRVVVRMFNPNLVGRLHFAVPNVVALSTSALAAPLLGLIARTGAALGTFRLEDGRLQQIAEVAISRDSPLCGAAVGSLPERGPLVVLAHGSATESHFINHVDYEAKLKPGDWIVLAGDAADMAPMLAEHDQDSLQQVLWANVVLRMGRTAARTLAEIDLPVKICTGVLLSVILCSTLVFHLSIDNESAADALYRTISLMATGADMGGGHLPHGGWQKVFVSVMRLAGAALTAAFTAILTNYLVRAHLGGAFEIRRIPDRGHIIVCGLGNVGFRVVDELVRQGERVVVIERSRDNPFVTSTRRLGVPVIIGDATLAEVQRQARAVAARAVVAATNQDLVNLEIGLLARELNPHQRVVLLLVDSQLAQTVREAAGVRLAFSVPALAAPAFAAALLGDRVHSVILVAGKLLAVVDVTAADSFLVGQSVRALAVDYDLAPIRLQAPDGTARPRPLNQRLAAGDQLTVILGLAELQRLLRREPAAPVWAVEVTECPLPMRGWMVQLARAQRGLAPEISDDDIAGLPCRVGERLTRGQAEDLLFLLGRERLAGRLVSMGTSADR
jgi:Trk K+ transport system NAD-binding subunit